MEKFDNLYNSIIDETLHIFDYYGPIVIENNIKTYESSCPNKNIICEASFTRLLSVADDTNRVFVVMSAHRAKFPKRINILRNRKLRGELNKKKLGVHNLVGHWRECQLPNVEYKDCPEDQLKDTIERSYFVVKPIDMDTQSFENLIISLMTIDGETQDAVIMRDSDGVYKILSNSGRKDRLGTKLTVNKIAQAYSQHCHKTGGRNIPFVFEGVEKPNGSIISYQLWNLFKEEFSYVK